MYSFIRSKILSILPWSVVKILRKVKSKIKIYVYYPFLKKGVRCKYIWHGNKYGGFFIYPNKLNKDSIVYSFGIGKDISFDEEIYEKYNCNIFCFDPTPRSIQFMKNQKLPDKIRFYDFGIDDVNGQVDFHLPSNSIPDPSGSIFPGLKDLANDKETITVNMKTLEQIMKELGHTHIDLLKMDIEGSEFKVLENILSTNISIGQMVVEFHDRFFEDNDEKKKSKQTITHLKEKGFKVFAVSTPLGEVSFIHENAL